MAEPKQKLSFDNTKIAFKHLSNRQLNKADVLFQLIGNKFLTGIGSGLSKAAISLRVPFAKKVIKWLIYEQFCGGETLKEARNTTVKELAERDIAVNLNYGVEAKESEREFDKALKKNLEAIQFGGENATVQILSVKPTAFGSISLFEKKQSGEKLSKAEIKKFTRIKERFIQICDTAIENDMQIYFDAEESWIQDEIDVIVDDLMAKYNQEKVLIFNTYQLYRHDRLAYLKKSFEKAKKENYLLGAKLVRGAYIEKENDRAEEMNYPTPLHSDKASVDKDYNLALEFCLKNVDQIVFCVASHNEESNLLCANWMDERRIERNHPHVWFSQLLGMGEHISSNLAHAGYNVAKYVPYGPVKEVIPYLIRRADENSSAGGQMSRELSIIAKELKRRGIG